MDTSAQPLILNGRIEQVAGNARDIRLPTELTGPQFDRTVPPPALQSFASQLAWTAWGGILTLTANNIYGGPDAGLHVGEPGSVVFRFAAGPQNSAVLQPTMIFFPGRDVPYDPRQMFFGTAQQPSYFGGRGNGGRLARFFGQPAPPRTTHMNFVYIALGAAPEHDSQGYNFNSSVVHNELKPLSQNAVEQDIVVQMSDAKTGRPVSYIETVVRFVRNGAQTAQAKVARLYYDGDRRLTRQTLLEGLVSTNWQYAAQNIRNYTQKSWDDVVRTFGL